MIGAARFWALRMWAARYWPKVGADGANLPANIIVATIEAASQTRSVSSGLTIRTVTATYPPRSVEFAG